MAEFTAEVTDLNEDPPAIRVGVQAAKVLLPGIMVDRHQGRMRSVLPRLALNMAEVVGIQTTVMAWATGHDELVVPMLGAIAAKKVLGSFLERRENKVIREDTGMSEAEMRSYKNETPPTQLVRSTLRVLLPWFLSNRAGHYEKTGIRGSLGAIAGAGGEIIGGGGAALGVLIGNSEIAVAGGLAYIGGRCLNMLVERVHNIRNNRR